MDPEEKKAWKEDIDKYKGKGPEEGYNEGWVGRKRTDVLTRSPWMKISHVLLRIFEAPVEWFHEKVVIANRPEKPEVYYHKKYRRVPTVDTCYVDDYACRYEATEQYKRDRQVDSEIVDLLRQRVEECFHYHGGWHGDAGFRYCDEMQYDWIQSEINFKMKYGNAVIGPPTAVRAYMRQRVRMVREELYFMWLREHKEQLKDAEERKATQAA